MNTVGFFIARFNNFKRNSPNLSKKNKINNLKINIIINNIVKTRRDNNSNFLNNKGDLKRGNKRGEKSYNKNNNNKNKKYKSLNQINIIKKGKNLNLSFFSY